MAISSLGLLDVLIFEIERRIRRKRGGGTAKGDTGSSGDYSLEELETFLARLHQIKAWLEEDPKLIPVIDDTLGKHLRQIQKQSLRQNRWLAYVTTIVGAMLGWGISVLFSHINLVSLFSR